MDSSFWRISLSESAMNAGTDITARISCTPFMISPRGLSRLRERKRFRWLIFHRRRYKPVAQSGSSCLHDALLRLDSSCALTRQGKEDTAMPRIQTGPEKHDII